MRRRKHGFVFRAFHRLLATFFWLAIVVATTLTLLDRSLPGIARRRIENTLSSDSIAVSIGGASFNLFKGIFLKNVEVYRKRSLEPPLASVDVVQVAFDPSLGTPPSKWLARIHCKNLSVSEYNRWQELFDSLPPCDLSAQPLPEMAFRFSAENAQILDIAVRYLGCSASLSPYAVKLERIRISPDAFGFLETLTGTLDYSLKSGNLSAMLTGTLTPSVIRRFTLSLDGDAAVDYYDAITDIQTPFNVTGEVKTGGDSASTDIRLMLAGGDFHYRGTPVRNVKFGLQWLSDPTNVSNTGKRLMISPLNASFGEGLFSGRLAWYPKTHATELQAQSTLPLDTLFKVINFPLPDFTTNIVFSSPPHTEVHGRVFPKGFGYDAFSGKVTASHATAYRLPFDAVSAAWSYDEESASATVTNFNATLAGGSASGSFSALTSGLQPFSLNVSASGVKTDPLRRIFDPGAPPSDGTLALTARLAGNLATNTLSSLSGSAEAHARKAAITRIPIFAGLTDFIGRNVAGVDLLVMQSDSDVSLKVDKGLATIERLSVDGNMMSIVSRGKWRIDAPTMPVEGVAQVRFFHSRSLMGLLARIVTLPVSKLMEFRVYGEIARPKWEYIGLIDRIAEATFWPRKDATNEQ